MAPERYRLHLTHLLSAQQFKLFTLRAITLDMAAAWREFVLELNTRLLT